MKIMTLHGTNKVFCLVLKYHFPFYPRPDSRVGTEAGANEGFATKTHGEISFGVFGSGNLVSGGQKTRRTAGKTQIPEALFLRAFLVQNHYWNLGDQRKDQEVIVQNSWSPLIGISLIMAVVSFINSFGRRDLRN